MRLENLLYLFIIFLGGSVLLSTASGVKYAASLQDSVITPVSDSINIAEGKKLYESKCGKCHSLYKPKDYKLRQWKANLDEMMNKAELNKHQYELIFAYLKENCRK